MTDRREIEQFKVSRSARKFWIDFYRTPWETTRPPAGVVMDIETARMLRDALDRQIAHANLENLPDRPKPSPTPRLIHVENGGIYYDKWLENSGPAEDLVGTEVHGHS